ncbi:MAG: hypothetical protein EA344_02355 [Alkalicoccus sp.]|nr:MAG: hypothetical protein EA344_02355 [Alkalicoccus sp.]
MNTVLYFVKPMPGQRRLRKKKAVRSSRPSGWEPSCFCLETAYLFKPGYVPYNKEENRSGFTL